VDEHERDRVRAARALVDEVDLDAVDRRLELVELVQFAFLRAPVVLIAPIRDQLLEVRGIRPVVPVGIVEAVGVLRALLDDLGLEGFLKTTGGKGLHVVVPIRPTLDWTQAKGFTKAVADLLVGTFPDRFIATVSKAQRKGKIFIDYLRNAEGATAIAPYAIRARAKAPVSTPIGWKELDTDVRFDHFNVRTIPERLRGLRQDPWAAIGEVRQTVTRAMFKRVRYEG